MKNKAIFKDHFERLLSDWRVASLDRNLGWKEMLVIPVSGLEASLGAAALLSILCYPESREKRDKFSDAILARMIKETTEARSPERRAFRDSALGERLLNIPNKRIDQTMARGLRRFQARLRAAWVLGKKLSSHEDPAHQIALRDLMLIAAETNTPYYPAFGSSEDDEDQVINSFRQRVMTPTKPVAHLSLAIQSLFLASGDTRHSPINLVRDADSWLLDVVEFAEKLRVYFGDLFPNHESTHLTTRHKNYSVQPSEMIAIFARANSG